MILAALAATSLIVAVAIDSTIEMPRASSQAQVSLAQKNVAVKPFVSTATECIIRSVSADPRFADFVKAGNVNELIVDSMSGCGDAMRAMIDGYDRYFGPGMGEKFFLGPYLDVLPRAVNDVVRASGHDR